MIQVDIFWSFAFGAFFASCARKQLRHLDAIVNEYFVFTVVFLSCIFSPSGTYLLHRFPGWETMFVFNQDIHPVLPTLFTLTNTLCGIIGFQMSAAVIQRGEAYTSFVYCTHAYMAMMAILGGGYDRFLFSGTYAEWVHEIPYQLADFFSSEVFYTLLFMAPFIFVPMAIAAHQWPSHPTVQRDSTTEFDFTEENKSEILNQVVTTALLDCGAFAIFFLLAAIIPGLEILPPVRVGFAFHRVYGLFVSTATFLILFTGLFALLPTDRKSSSLRQ
eukprot:TRINITY_DN10007_c0_g1_i1.p1 TRINITY_DN10007_c0_g1~~TRINITY_DN10007_c0_g1_i1.p1  ORF type:complete len:274 (+),score=52.56 TRINITY_DN10007_c0_g1_i1:47-868(+)